MQIYFLIYNYKITWDYLIYLKARNHEDQLKEALEKDLNPRKDQEEFLEEFHAEDPNPRRDPIYMQERERKEERE